MVPIVLWLWIFRLPLGAEVQKGAQALADELIPVHRHGEPARKVAVGDGHGGKALALAAQQAGRQQRHAKALAHGVEDGLRVVAFPGDLRAQAKRTIALRTTDDDRAIQVVPGLSYDGDWLVSTRADDAWCARASLALAQAGIGVIRMEEHADALEDIFLRLTGSEA